MVRPIVFFIFVFILVAIVYSKPIEGFLNPLGNTWTSKNAGTPDVFNNKESNMNPTLPVAQLGIGSIEPGPPPASNIPTAPAGFNAKETPNPYRNPTNEPAKYIRILAAKEEVQAFFGFQAQSLENTSDPSIQIPLTRARADLSDLINVQSVMERNPGLASRINNKQLDDIKSNLNYLQRSLYDLKINGIVKEGFSSNLPTVNPPTLPTVNPPTGPSVSSGTSSGLSGPAIPTGATGSTGVTAPMGSSGPPRPVVTPGQRMQRGLTGIQGGPGPRATIRDLQEFQIKLVVELKRLEASGTSDTLTRARISSLTIIKKDIDDVITKIEKGFYNSNTVPIFKSDIRNSLPLLGNLNKPLPQFLNKYDLPPAIASLFPGGLSPRDNEQAAQINNVVKGYMKQISEGVSWGVKLNVRYDNPNARKLAPHPDYKRKGSYTPASGIPGLKRSASLKIGRSKGSRNSTRSSKGSRNSTRSSKGSRNSTRSSKGSRNSTSHNTKMPLKYKTNNTCTSGLPGSSNFRIFPDPVSGHLDWKKRSSQIVSQIKKRGLRPAQFGAMDPKVKVSKDFSWRGYTRMMCSRLNATTDPGLSVTVGCPPENWHGWRQ